MKNLLKRFSSFSNAARGAAGPNPVRDWLMLLAAAGVILAASVAWNAWYFSHIEDGDAPVDAGAGALEAYPAGLVQEVSGERAAEAEAYRTAYPFIDPSR